MSDYQLLHLAENIDLLDLRFQEKALPQVNILHSIRNWLIGLYLVQYECHYLSCKEKSVERPEVSHTVLLNRPYCHEWKCQVIFVK